MTKILLDQNIPAPAVQWLQKEVGSEAEIIRNIGWMKCMSGKVKEGRSCLRQSIKLDPKNGLAYNDLGASYMFTQDLNLQLAERWLKKALELEPNNAFSSCFTSLY